jgi:hypothetical protein
MPAALMGLRGLAAEGTGPVPAEWGSAASMRIRAALHGVAPDWPNAAAGALFLDEVARQGILSLLHHRLTLAGALATWPRQARARLAAEARAQAVRHLLLERELGTILAALAEAGIRPLLIKGVPLAHSRYAFPYLRPVSDTDLLVRAADREQTDRILKGAGYLRPTVVTGSLVSQQASYTKLDRSGPPHVLDVHWKVSNANAFKDALSFEELARAGIPVPALGEHARTPCDVHALILACLHRVAHHPGDDRIIWLHDIHLLASVLTGDRWGELMEAATRKRLCSVVWNGLAGAVDWFATAVPADVERRLLEAAEAEPLAQYVRPGLGWWGRLRLELGVLSWRDRTRFIGQHVFPSPDYVLRRYGASRRLLLPALYLRRAAGGAFRRLLRG